MFDFLGVEYGLFAGSIGNRLLLKQLRISSLTLSKFVSFF